MVARRLGWRNGCCLESKAIGSAFGEIKGSIRLSSWFYHRMAQQCFLGRRVGLLGTRTNLWFFSTTVKFRAKFCWTQVRNHGQRSMEDSLEKGWGGSETPGKSWWKYCARAYRWNIMGHSVLIALLISLKCSRSQSHSYEYVHRKCRIHKVSCQVLERGGFLRMKETLLSSGKSLLPLPETS